MAQQFRTPPKKLATQIPNRRAKLDMAIAAQKGVLRHQPSSVNAQARLMLLQLTRAELVRREKQLAEYWVAVDSLLKGGG